MTSNSKGALPIFQPVIYPVLGNVDVDSVRKFVEARNEYLAHCKAAKTDPKTLKSSIAPHFLSIIGKHHLKHKCAAAKVTEELLKEWILKIGNLRSTRDFDMRLKTHLRMKADGGIVDEFWRFIGQFYQIVEDSQQQRYIEQDNQRAVQLVLGKIEPAEFRLRLQLDLESTHYDLREDFDGFVDYVAEQAWHTDRFVGLPTVAKKKGHRPKLNSEADRIC